MKYMILTYEDPQALAFYVNQQVERGWEPLGSPSVYVDPEQPHGEGRLMFLQALVVVNTESIQIQPPGSYS